MDIVTIGGLPVYACEINEETDGMERVSLVDYPAVMSDFQKFKDEKPVRMFSVEDEEKRLVYGVLMRADFPIYRRDSSGEYYLIFKADTIRRMAEKYLLEGRQNNVNLMHEDGSDVTGVDMVQMFIKDTAKGVSPTGFEDIADGSLFAEYHITNDEVWAQVKDGTFRGFSIEGYFDIRPEQDKSFVDEIVDALAGAFRQLFSNQTNTRTKMSKIEKIKATLASILAEFATMTTDKGILTWDGDDDLKVGARPMLQMEDGTTETPADGVYTTAEGTAITIASGAVTEIMEKEDETDAKKEDGKPEETQAAEETQSEDIDALRKEVNELYKIVDGLLKDAGKTRDDVLKMALITEGTELLSRIDAAEQIIDGLCEYCYITKTSFNKEGEPRARIDAMIPPLKEIGKWFGYVVVEGNAEKTDEEMMFSIESALETMTQYMSIVKLAEQRFSKEMEPIKTKMAALSTQPASSPASQEFAQTQAVQKTGNEKIDRICEAIRKGKK